MFKGSGSIARALIVLVEINSCASFLIADHIYPSHQSRTSNFPQEQIVDTVCLLWSKDAVNVFTFDGRKWRIDSVSIADVTKDFVFYPCILSWFLAMKNAREALALPTTSKSSNLRKVYLTYWLYWIV